MISTSFTVVRPVWAVIRADLGIQLYDTKRSARSARRFAGDGATVKKLDLWREIPR